LAAFKTSEKLWFKILFLRVCSSLCL
jgi:hypothetical protein